MTLTVSVSELRTNISTYLERVAKGARVLIRDEKKDITIAQITQAYFFDKTIYEKTLRKAAGIFTKENHPEWSTTSKVSSWLSKNRLNDERSF
jgi:antitoxin (DNA-binding transcriptional repressor) of toxin-antitoxin stability system